MALVVTTPLTESDEAREAQKLLKSNRFDDFLEGPVDRVWGPECRRATLRAKKALGYTPEAAANPVFGKLIKAFLEGRELTDEMKARRRAFLENQKVSIRKAALALAREQLGTVERPEGSNDTRYSRWYMGDSDPDWTASRPGPAWCMIFCSWVYDKAFTAAGMKGFPRAGARYAFCPFVVTDGAQHKFGLDQVRDPAPGDLVLYQFDTDSNADHVGLFEKWTNKSRGDFTAIEGNTSSSSDANGGRVERRNRNVSQVYRPRTGGRAFVRVSPID